MIPTHIRSSSTIAVNVRDLPEGSRNAWPDSWPADPVVKSQLHASSLKGRPGDPLIDPPTATPLDCS